MALDLSMTFKRQNTFGSGNGRPQKMNRAMAKDSYQDKDITAMDEGVLEDAIIVDKQMEANMLHIEGDVWLNLPDVPFNVLMMMLTITDLRRLTQVSSSWKNRIMENFLKNPANHKTLRARAWSRRALGFWMVPSNEEITNVIWLSKYDLALFVMGIILLFTFSKCWDHGH